MSNKENTTDVQSQVLKRIESGELRMRPRIYFILKAAVVVFVAVLVLLLSVFLSSFIFFGLRFSGHDSLLGFGYRGIELFVSLFPWPLALLNVALIFILEWLLHRFRFIYRRSLLYLFLILIVAAATFGLVIDRETDFHDARFEEAERGELIEPLEQLYESAHTKLPEERGIYRGSVTEVHESSFEMVSDDFDADEDDGTWKVFPPKEEDLSEIIEGDRVYVAGEREEDGVHAYGMRELSD